MNDRVQHLMLNISPGEFDPTAHQHYQSTELTAPVITSAYKRCEHLGQTKIPRLTEFAVFVYRHWASGKTTSKQIHGTTLGRWAIRIYNFEQDCFNSCLLIWLIWPKVPPKLERLFAVRRKHCQNPLIDMKKTDCFHKIREAQLHELHAQQAIQGA